MYRYGEKRANKDAGGETIRDWDTAPALAMDDLRRDAQQ
jgi:hypothetical protein